MRGEIEPNPIEFSQTISAQAGSDAAHLREQIRDLF